MRALVTGNRGFVGRHFCRWLVERGWEVTGVDIKPSAAGQVEIWNDITGSCHQFFHHTKEQFDLVVHLAALVGGRATIDGQPLQVANDLSIDAEFFNWVVNTKQPRVVYYSSSAAYPVDLQTGKPPYRLVESDIDLRNPRLPDQTYGWAKLTGEMLAELARKQGTKVHVLRPFSGFGEDQDDCYPFPAFIKRALGRPDYFDVWGSLDQTRDFIHIDDVVAATMAIVEADVEEPVNLGWGRRTSMRDLACMILGELNHGSILRKIDGPLGVMHRVCDNSRMLLHYAPKITLEEGIRRALRAAASKP